MCCRKNPLEYYMVFAYNKYNKRVTNERLLHCLRIKELLVLMRAGTGNFFCKLLVLVQEQGDDCYYQQAERAESI